MLLPAALLDSLQNVPGFNQPSFEEVHASGRQVTAIRQNPSKWPHNQAAEHLTVGTQPVPWSKHGFYLPLRPSFTLDPSFHAGAYYVQDASSMFLEQALTQLVDLSQPLRVLDLCAAPGGKSTHIQSLLSAESVLVSNEVIRTRVNILAENLTKWGAPNTIVTNNDPEAFRPLLELFDVIVVDAPCSGSGLFRKDPEAIEEWSPANVALCSQRQQRILADIWPSLKPGGLLIYSTCSYSQEEDEQIADWLTSTHDAENQPLQIGADWGIVETQSTDKNCKGYRFYPDKVDGEGFYLACFKKQGVDGGYPYERNFKNQADKKVQASMGKWLSEDSQLEIYQHKEQVFGMPAQTLQLFGLLQKQLNVRKAGIKLGDWMREELLPDHALAMSTLYNRNLPFENLPKEQAIQYLRRADVAVDGLPKGWLMMAYEGLPLGWVKSLGNRFNNYYPKEWRIRM